MTDTLPQHLQPVDPSRKTYGTVVFDKSTNTWVLKAEPQVLDFAKRIFPGAKGRSGAIRFHHVDRWIENLNWLMLRFPLEIKNPGEYAAAYNRAIQMAQRREGIGAIAPIGPIPRLRGELFPYQAEDVARMVATRRCLNACATGLGKALAADTPVVTPAGGWVAIGKLRVGDTVMGTDGLPHRVTGVFPQGVRPAFRATTKDGSSVVCDKDHLWNVSTKGRRLRRSPARTLTLGQIMREGLTDGLGARHFLPEVQPVAFSGTRLPLDPWTLGVLLGDGGMSGATVRLCTNEQIIDRLVLPAGVLVRKTDHPSEGIVDAGLVTEPQSAPNPLLDCLRVLGLWGCRAEDKFIPASYLIGSIEQRRALLTGLLDTDGHVRADKNIEWGSVSRRLAEEVRLLVLSLGGTATIREKLSPRFHYKGELRHGQTYYRMSVRLPGDRCPFTLPAKAEKWAPFTKYLPARTIKAIEPAGECEMVCISVDAPDKLFLVGDFIPTHNTVEIIAAIAAADAFPALIVVQPHVQLQWEAMIEAWLTPPTPPGMLPGIIASPRYSYHRIRGLTPYELPQRPIYLTHYGLLTAWLDVLTKMQLKSVSFDEVQELRRPESKKYGAAVSISQGATYCFGASATPIMGYGQEIHSVMSAIEYNCLGDKTSFVEQWGHAHDPRRVAHPDKLGRYLQDEGLMFIRTKEEVKSQLPPKRRITVPVDQDDHLYNKMVAEAVRLAGDYGNLSFFERGKATRQIDTWTRKASGVAKAKSAGEFIGALVAAGERVVVGAHHHEVHQMLTTILSGKTVRVTGMETPAEKARAIEQFSAGEKPVCLLALRAATGIDGLQKSATCTVFAELDWSPQIHLQCEDRVWRYGLVQDSEIPCYYLVAKNTYDSVVMEVLGLKVGQFCGLMGEEEKPADEPAVSQRHLEMLIDRLRKDTKTG